MIGRNGLAVLHALLFDFLNCRSGAVSVMGGDCLPSLLSELSLAGSRYVEQLSALLYVHLVLKRTAYSSIGFVDSAARCTASEGDA